MKSFVQSRVTVKFCNAVESVFCPTLPMWAIYFEYRLTNNVIKRIIQTTMIFGQVPVPLLVFFFCIRLIDNNNLDNGVSCKKILNNIRTCYKKCRIKTIIFLTIVYSIRVFQTFYFTPLSVARLTKKNVSHCTVLEALKRDVFILSSIDFIDVRK